MGHEEGCWELLWKLDGQASFFLFSYLWLLLTKLNYIEDILKKLEKSHDRGAQPVDLYFSYKNLYTNYDF